MELFPAIDLRDGRCVRLAQGDFGRETVYGTDPVLRAKTFESAGARWLHVVDLDAVRTGVATNRPVIAAIANAVAIPVQAGGGVRRAEDVAELLDAGVTRVMVGTAAILEKGFLAGVAERWPGQVAAAVDHRDGEVRVKGWSEGSGRDVAGVVCELAAAGAAAVMVTEISRDGLMLGPDLAGYRLLLEECEVPLIASGGVGTLDDIRRLAWLQGAGRHLAGVIVGRAIYEGRFTVPEAVAASRGGPVGAV
ncbi:MAG TPA: 1-(5-phosphoribosyl)-5-[(5-phosphoribosylamino)methylideneamino]imidazole-4-carboxamide isomerase [Acidimicrobiales bacterium]|nr:1-(5-phosphoribosyl)-5-[(5-phosphoribosylamino)methylideneamino]imidazole-4-carboxamide isomerase [Acidimicrobiales bacterium]